MSKSRSYHPLNIPIPIRWLQLLAIWLAGCFLLALLLRNPRFQRTGLARPLAGALVGIDFQLQDRFLGLLPRRNPLSELVFLGIDESTLRVSSQDPDVVAQSRPLSLLAEPYPWSREIWALTVERLLDAGARLVMLDLVFSTPREGDDSLRKLLETHPDRILLVSSIETPGMFQNQGALLQCSEPVETVVSDFDFLINNVGYANFFPDPDGVVRRIIFETTLRELQGSTPHPDEDVFSSLSAVALRHLEWDQNLQGKGSSFQIQFPRDGNASYPVRPLYEIFWPSLWEANYQSGKFFEDKVVIVGPAANQFQDIHTTPAGDLLGPQLHLSAITAAREGGLFRRATGSGDVALIFLFGLAGFLLVGYFRHPVTALLTLGGTLLFPLLLAWLILAQGHVLVSLLGPILALTGVGGSGLALDHARVYRERFQLRRALERRVSKEVMEEILADPHGYLNELGGVRRQVCVLFSDLRGFTAISEWSPPEAVLAQLNQYFDVMVNLIHTERGMVDKFIGDAIMSIWGSIPPLAPEEASRKSVSAALQMIRALPELNDDFKISGASELRLGIGIHRGEVITGNVGSEKRLEFTAIGDTVNLASRLEGVTKQYGLQLVVSDAVAKDLGDEWVLRPVDRVRVVGRRAPLLIHEPLATPGDPPPEWEEQKNFADQFRKAFDLYQVREFERAAKMFAKMAAKNPADAPTAILLKRCRQFQKEPPEPDWNGSIDLTSK